MANIEIIQGDCLEVMKSFKDGQFDLCLTDPPYGIGADKGVGGFGSSPDTAKHYNDNWDVCTPPKKVFDEVLRVCKNSIIWGGNYFELPIGNKWLVWDKIGGFKFRNPFSDCELAWTSFRGNTQKYVFIQQGCIRDTKDKRFHPTQKPTELLAMILKDFANENCTVLDPFAGSCSTAVACERMNYNCVAIEINPIYCEIGKKRIEQEKAKIGLFNGMVS